MEISVAKNLIQHGVDPSRLHQTWADLGSGDGLFTTALADLLPSGSEIIAIDKDQRALQNVSVKTSGVLLNTIVADLNNLPKSLPLLDGIVMANSLHYVKDQSRFLLKIKSDLLKDSGVLILVEYNLEKANPWVPFPISKKKLAALAPEAGFGLEINSNTVKSKLNSSEIYCAVLKPAG